MLTPDDALTTAIGLLPFVEGYDGRRAVGATAEDLGSVPFIAQHPDLHRWLSHCNGLLLSDLRELLGVGPSREGHISVESRADVLGESMIEEYGFFPIANDGCGNDWVYHAGGVSFLEAIEYPHLNYDAASSLGHFLVPILAKAVRVEDQWGFNEANVTWWDPDLVARSDRLPWNT
jgi:hypothetical protein